MALRHGMLGEYMTSEYDRGSWAYKYKPNPKFVPNKDDTYMAIFSTLGNAPGQLEALRELVKQHNGRFIYEGPMAKNMNYPEQIPHNQLLIFEFE